MSEYTEKRWRCDSCGLDVRRGVIPPAGWREVRLDMYGNTTHCCADGACVAKLEAFCKANYPSADVNP